MKEKKIKPELMHEVCAFVTTIMSIKVTEIKNCDPLHVENYEEHIGDNKEHINRMLKEFGITEETMLKEVVGLFNQAHTMLNTDQKKFAYIFTNIELDVEALVDSMLETHADEIVSSVKFKIGMHIVDGKPSSWVCSNKLKFGFPQVTTKKSEAYCFEDRSVFERILKAAEELSTVKLEEII